MQSPPRHMTARATAELSARGGYTSRSTGNPPAAMTAPKTGPGLITPTPRRQPSVPDKPEKLPPHSYSGGTRD